MRLAWLMIVAIVLWLVWTVSHANCGIPPLPPIPPIGTSNCEPVCECDAAGRECHWVWQCQ